MYAYTFWLMKMQSRFTKISKFQYRKNNIGSRRVCSWSRDEFIDMPNCFGTSRQMLLTATLGRHTKQSAERGGVSRVRVTIVWVTQFRHYIYCSIYINWVMAASPKIIWPHCSSSRSSSIMKCVTNLSFFHIFCQLIRRPLSLAANELGNWRHNAWP